MKKSKILNRKRIFSDLSAVYDFPLTIVEAPMGFGKTTAVKSFFTSEKQEPQWVTFRNSDNSSALFWDAFASKISERDENAGAALKSLGFPLDASSMDKILSVLSDLTIQNKIMFVMDDYHLSQNLQLNKFILQLAQEEITGLHMIVITRDTTDFDFVELLAKELCYVVSRQKLKFTEDEVGDYCRMMMADISLPDLTEICEYTGGWVSFIYLILLGLEQGIPVGMSGTIDELIEKALFNTYDSAIQVFLLRLSIMDEFTAEQAGFVTRNENTAAILRRLSRKNAFVFFDEANKIYKIHNVLLDFLRMKQNFSAETIQELYGRLGDWYLEKEDFSNAYACLYRAGQSERILSLLNEPKNIRNKLPDFEGEDEMFNCVPKEQLFQYPLAYLQHIFLSLISGKMNSTLSWVERLDELQNYYEGIDCVDDEYPNRIIAEIYVTRVFTLFNHADKILTAFKKVVKILKGQQSYLALPSNVYTFGSPHYLYLYFRREGSFTNLKDSLSQSVGYSQFSNGCGEGSDSLSAAEYALETGDWNNVELNNTKAILKAETKNQTSIIICAKFCLARFQIYQGKVLEAIELLGQLEKDIESTNFPAYHSTFDMCRGYLYSCLGQPEKIPFWLQTGDMATATLYYQGVGFNYLVYGKALMASGRYTELEVQIESFQKQFSLYSNQLGLIQNYIFLAVANYHLYGIDVGTVALEKGLFQAQNDNLVMPFIETAIYILKMVEVIAEKYPNNAYIQRILSGCHQYEQHAKSVSYEVVALSQRELSVLSLAAEGLRRKEIAARLFISEGTVKTHYKNIYEKLEASGKVEAIKIAQARGYIASNLSVSKI
nr:LuxR C-terminal-related transcriptional regulator [uncultured Caproiciproducens sp.]